ncbi:lipase member I-like [Danaus plexippus]|uniref:lipase member I-like n=1 Tax=Danaus plexippus TaxID=13037 RepID=UPI002AAF5579|nr:lipase member I-like [Danaus plexippus]
MFRYLLILSVAVIVSNGSPATKQGNFNTYFAYTRKNLNRPIELKAGEINEEAVVDLTLNKTTVVIIHGHRGSVSTTLNPTVKNAFLRSEDLDVIVVDWSVYASQSYSNAVNAVPSVGENLAGLINELVRNGVVELSTLHMVGFDLGAHVAGFAGRLLDGQVARITGLNPSRGQWGENSQRLSSSDAVYVEVIHTDGIGLVAYGVGDAIGDVDFYVNGGTNQPGCLLNNFCGHNRAWEVFAASLSNTKLIGNECNTWLQVTLNTCRGPTIEMGGNDLFKYASGMYRVNTGRRFPF